MYCMADGNNNTSSYNSNDTGMDMETGRDWSCSSSSKKNRESWDRKPTREVKGKFSREWKLKEDKQEQARLQGAKECKRYDDDAMDKSPSNHPSKFNGTESE